MSTRKLQIINLTILVVAIIAASGMGAFETWYSWTGIEEIKELCGG